MTAHVPSFSFSLDPLIAEAKRRARQRRMVLATIALTLAGGVAGGVLALGPTSRDGGSGRTNLTARAPTTSGGSLVSAVGGTVPYPVFASVRGRVIGWARTGSDWFAVYVDKPGDGWCGLGHDSWRIALIETASLPDHVVADRRIGGAMCGNELSWVRAGRFSDGQHREVAFLLWATPAIGATAYIYRVAANQLHLLATFHGDSLKLSLGRAVVGFENRGRSPHGELDDVYRFSRGRYRLAKQR